jgi:hypothetical protein
LHQHLVEAGLVGVNISLARPAKKNRRFGVCVSPAQHYARLKCCRRIIRRHEVQHRFS